jgi:hypothetical protein
LNLCFAQVHLPFCSLLSYQMMFHYLSPHFYYLLVFYWSLLFRSRFQMPYYREYFSNLIYLTGCHLRHYGLDEGLKVYLTPITFLPFLPLYASSHQHGLKPSECWVLDLRHQGHNSSDSLRLSKHVSFQDLFTTFPWSFPYILV